MKPLIIIQARLGSTRLPGKVLMEIRHLPMLAYLYMRLEDYDWALTTPDDQLFESAWSDAFLWEGNEDDVAGRFADVLGVRKPDTFIRLCGDSPLMDPTLINAAIALYEPPYLEIRSPVGCVEVCDTAAFLADLPGMSAHEREHVTLRLRPAGKIITVGSGPRLVVDTQADFDRVRGVIEKMTRPHTEYGWRECVSLL